MEKGPSSGAVMPTETRAVHRINVAASSREMVVRRGTPPEQANAMPPRQGPSRTFSSEIRRLSRGGGGRLSACGTSPFAVAQSGSNLDADRGGRQRLIATLHPEGHVVGARA